MAQALSNQKEELALLRYPGFGVLSRVNARGYGYIMTKSGGKFCHINDHAGRRLETMLDLSGRQCMYVVGGHPRRYMENKEGWDRWIVKWRLIDVLDIASASIYRQARTRAFENISVETLRVQLQADWYVQAWHSKTGHMPMATLRPDGILEACAQNHLRESGGIEELIGLLASLVNSPWYAVSEIERESTCKKFYIPREWAENVYASSRPPSKCKGFEDIVRYCGADFLTRFQRAKTIAIDLESNGEIIYEFGWKNSKGTGQRKSIGYLSKEEIEDAVSECTSGQASVCIVGHNLIGWDIPVLEKNDVALPDEAKIWDTLITSWILEPWRRSHALVAGERAHCADVDAAACYELFEHQIARLGSCIYGQDMATAVLVNRLYDDPKLFTQIDGRNYPRGLSDALNGTTLFPLGRATEFAWQCNCLPKFLATENVLLDPILVPESCRAIADQVQTIHAKAITAVVCDARSNNVYVRLSDLPGWLVDDHLRTILREAHKHCVDDRDADVAIIYIAEDFFKLSDDEVDHCFATGTLAIAYPGDVAAAWMETRCQKLRVEEMGKRFPAALEAATGRFLLPVQERDGAAAWLLHLPSPCGMTLCSSWFLLPAMPSWLQIKTDQKQIKAASLAQIPRWRDGDANRLDVDRIFISPDTANRPLYLADLTQCILSLLKSLPDEEVVVFGLRWPEEATQLQRNLLCLGVSAEHPGSPLRQLEYLRKKGLRVLACVRDKLPNYIQAAEQLGTKIQVVLDEVPLHDWYAILNAPPAPERTSVSRFLPNYTSGGSEDDEQTDSGVSDHACARVVLRGSDISSTTDAFLDGWLLGMGISAGEVSKCLILDARLVDHHTAVASQIPLQDVGFYSLEELLDAETLQIFYSVCYPKREVRDIPNDYESYRAFLKENWGFDDFRAGTQRPAIEKLIGSNRDMLLRLPTGAGKSVIFHLPALYRSDYTGRLTIVITPLRALMRDQAEGLWRKQFTESVDFLSGGRDPWLNHEVYQGILDGRLRLVFVSPERFRVPRFIEALERRRRMDDGLEFVVFDEAHCISEWGFEFRPDYLHAAQHVAQWYKKKQMLGNPHRFLLTSATVTQRNRIDMEKELALGRAGSYEDLPEEMPHPIQPYIVLESLEAAEEEEAPSDEKFEEIYNILIKLDLEKSAALVFVQRRKDCQRISEALNERASISNSGLASLHALPFHAGLPEAVKIQTCDQLRDRKVNVLICTKAFGMGMDIPHVHACIHHRPPTFIEDYLQEVGRIGRDEEERARAGHDRVTATLLYNQDDFERNLSLLHNNAVSPPDLQDLFAYCIDSSVRFDGVGKSLCLVSSKVQINHTKQFDENQVSNCLFWLERMGVLHIEGRQPPFLSLSIDLPGLQNHSKGSSLTSRIAASLAGILSESDDAIKELAGATPHQESRPQVETVFGRFIKGLLAGVLALLSPSRVAEPKPEVINPPRTSVSTPTPKKVDVSVSMSELMLRCGDISMDDLFAGLFQLSAAGVVWVHKSFDVLKSGTPSGDEFYDLLEFAVDRLLQPTKDRVDFLQRKQFESELREHYQEILAPFDQTRDGSEEDKDFTRLLKRRIQREVYRAISTSLRILRYAGLELREGLSESGVAHYARSIPDSLRFSAASSAHMSIEVMRRFVDFVSSVEDRSSQSEGMSFKIHLTQIMSALGGDVRIGRIKEIMKLVESAGFYEFESGLSEWVTLVTLNTQEPLPSHAPDFSEDTEVHRVYTEMLEKHDLQVLRAQAMVLMAAMPTENRKKYIDSYFQCVDAAGLTQLLEDTVGDVDDEVLANSPMLQNLLSQVRQERFSEEMEKLNDSQRAVCAAPFDRTLLVNAGPGSGKTHVLMMRCANLIHKQRIDPAEILVLAFNRAVVFEIRDRVRRLFRAIGYGSYANRLAVTTFHSSALRFQQESDLYEEDAIGQAVHTFAQRIASDSEFARFVGGGYKTVLVDEFQDMNQDFYSVVKVLLENCRGGGMVIGDDGQDILAWNRRKWQNSYGQECPLDAAYYFSQFRDSYSPDEYTLARNYRSAIEIVKRSSGMIAKAAEEIGFTRMKAGTELLPERTDCGYVERLFGKSNCPDVVAQAMKSGKSVAVLCRSNRECRQMYDLLIKVDGIPSESVELLGSEDLPLYKMRHSGTLLDICRKRKDYEFVEPYIWEEFMSEFVERDLADPQMSQRYVELIYELVKTEVGRPRVRDLQSFIKEMYCSDVERLKANIRSCDQQSRLTIATVHKVKGLEFDTVLIIPSNENYPYGENNDRLSTSTAADAAEEARIYYVAMTRARNRLYRGWGDRERSWWQRIDHRVAKNANEFRLKIPQDFFYVSWPGQKPQVDRGLQAYIEKRVCIGDPLDLRGRYLWHNGHDVGKLSNKGANSLLNSEAGSRLRVSNVIRYTCGNHFREHRAGFWEKLHDEVKLRGWSYLVLAEKHDGNGFVMDPSRRFFTRSG